MGIEKWKTSTSWEGRVGKHLFTYEGGGTFLFFFAGGEE